MLSRFLFLLIVIRNIKSQGVLPVNQARFTIPNVSHGVGPSPKCWDSALRLFQMETQKNPVDDVALCSAMPEIFQRILVLEITKCHMADVGKPLFLQKAEICNKSPASSDALDELTMVMCLKLLTEVGLTTYTLYMTHIHGLCNRLNAESMLKYQRDTQRDLSARYAEFTKNTLRDLNDHRTLLRDVDLMTKRILQDMEKMKSNVTKLIESSMHEALTNQIRVVSKREADSITKIVVEQVETHLKLALGNGTKELNRRLELSQNSTHKIYDSCFEGLANMTAHMANSTKQIKQWMSASKYRSWPQTEWHPMMWLSIWPHLNLDTAYFFLFLIISMFVIDIMSRFSFHPSVRTWLGRLFLAEQLIELSIFFAVKLDVQSIMDGRLYIYEARKYNMCMNVLGGFTGIIAYPAVRILTLPVNLLKSLYKITCLNLFGDSQFPKTPTSSDLDKVLLNSKDAVVEESTDHRVDKVCQFPKRSTSSDLNKVLLNSTDAVVGASTDHRAAAIAVDHNYVSDLGQSYDDDSVTLAEESSVTSKLMYRKNRVPKIRKRQN